MNYVQPFNFDKQFYNYLNLSSQSFDAYEFLHYFWKKKLTNIQFQEREE